MRSLPRATEWLPAAVVLAVGLYEIWIGTVFDPGWDGPRPVATVALLLLAGALLARRAAPLRALALVGVSAAGQFAMVTDPEQSQIAVETFIGLLVVSYSVAVRANRLHALYAFAAIVFLEVLSQAIRPSPSAAEEVLGVMVLLGLTWMAGSGVRARQERIRELAAEAARRERDRDADAHRAAAAERARIARELHDLIAHGVSVMVVQTGAARHSLRSDPDVAAASLLSAEQTGREALAEMRRLVGLMREQDAPLAPAPGLDAVPVLVERFVATGLPVRLDVEPGMPDLAAGVDLAAYRVVQEGLTNALKHAGRVDTHVEIGRSNGTLHIAIRTAGGPPGEGAEGAGHGLVGLRERVALYGGDLEAGRQPDGSFLLRAAIPLEDS